MCDAQDRLGYNIDELKGHPFFRGTDWEHIRDRPAAIPIVVKHMADTSNFDDFEELDDQKRCKLFTNGVWTEPSKQDTTLTDLSIVEVLYNTLGT